MRLYEVHQLVIEGYKEAQQEFAAASDEETAKEVIAKYRDLVNRNQVQGNERNIDYWRKQGFASFKQFVDNKSQQTSMTQVKRSKKSSESITLAENSDWLIVIPLDKDASCFHGKNTNWCTTKPMQSYFERYFYEDQVTLIYFIRKSDMEKWAIAVHKVRPNNPELFDKNDKKITRETFDKQTGLSSQKFIGMALSDDAQSKVTGARDKYRKVIEYIKNELLDVKKGEHNYKLEELLFKVKHNETIESYLKRVGKSSGYDKKLQKLVVNLEGFNIQYIENPDKKLQMDAVQQYGGDPIQFIENPDKDVQMVVVQQNGRTIRFIENPDKDIQMAAVKQNILTIQYIKNPDKDVQMAAVKQDGYNIFYISNPDKDVQMAAVKQNGKFIYHIDNPHPDVQMAAVKQNIDNIQYIEEPDKDVVKYVKDNS